MFVVHPPPPLVDRFLLFYFGRFYMYGSGGRVSQNWQYFQTFVEHCHYKIFLLQPLLILNQAVVGNLVIHPYQIKCMEHGWHQNTPAPKIMMAIINQQVLPIKYKNPLVVIIYGYGN